MKATKISRIAMFTIALLSFGYSNLADALGPASKRTALIISEVMYHPADRADGKNLEYIEIYNSDGVPKNLSGFRISGEVEYLFPAGTVIGARSFIVVAGAPADLQAAYGVNALGPFLENKKLANEGGLLELWSKSGALLLDVEYSDEKPWPPAADGSGHSLVLARPTFGQNNPQAWAASALIGGSPGTNETIVTPSPLVLNEILAHTDEPVEDYIELYNHSNGEVPLAGYILTDDPDTNKFVIGDISIPAGGFVSFTQSQLGFALSSAGETILLKNPANTRVIDAVRFGGQENNVSWGRFPNGGPEWRQLNVKSPGAGNLALRRSPVVINELMYSPISHEDDDQFVELLNASDADVDVSGWGLAGGVRFTIPTNTVLPRNGYLVIAKNAARLLANYTNLNSTNLVGNFSGRLAGSGERIVLTKPDLITQTNNGVVTNITIHIEMDEVTYGTGGRWPELADGGGSSLELIDRRSNGRLAPNWAASDESRKAPWTLIEATGVLDNGTGEADQFQMHLQGAGEVLVDNVEVLNASGVNQIANGTFETDASLWTAQGTQEKSGRHTTEGYNSARSYRIRAVDRGDTGANRIRRQLTAPLAVGQVGTIRAQARWLAGHPEVLLRVRGNYLEAIGKLTIPKNLGTPGALNSRSDPFDSLPAIYSVMHSPVLPAANQGIVVTARVEGVEPISPIQVVWRIDRVAGSGGTLPMNDNGTGGDAVAADGIYSAIIPGTTSGRLIAFYVRASYSGGGTSLFPNDAPARECLVRIGETQPAGPIGTYRMWMTEATRALWASGARGPLNNAPLDVTFVYNNERVIYNLKAMYAGSPYIAPGYSGPTSGLCGYTGEFPKDDLFLGVNDFVLDWPGRDRSAVEEQMSYFLADEMGLPNSHRRFIHLHVNGVSEQSRGSVYEDVQQPGGDMIKQWSAQDTEGHFYKIERWFEFTDEVGLMSAPEPELKIYTTTGDVKKLARYRWNWVPRAIQKSANDFDDIFAWADAANETAPEPYTSSMEAITDMEEVMGIFAVERIINNFDSWGHAIGKNMYAYKPVNGRWITFMFDNDWLMEASQQANYSVTSPLFTPSTDSTVLRMYNHPPFRRAYWRNIKKAIDALQATNINPVMDAKYAMLTASGVTQSAGASLITPASAKSWFAQRRNFLITQLNTAAANFEITSNGGANFESPTSVATLTGTAPIDVLKIAVNGVAYPVTWTTQTNWSLRVPLSGASTVLNLQGVDVKGNLIAGLTDSIMVTYLGAIESALGNVVFNEIMYHPTNSGGGFIELRSLATNTTFDLSNWRIEGVGFTFPQGTSLSPGGFAVVAGNQAAFTAAYGNLIPLAGEFPGQLRNDGETLWLVKPGATAAQDLVIDEVTYSDATPWPAAADGSGASLQLIDARQDNNRALNWAAVASAPTTEVPQSLLSITNNWKYNQTANLGTGWFAANYNDSAWPSGPGLLYVEDSKLPAPMSTALSHGRTTYYFRTHFNFTGDPTKVVLNLSTVIDDGVVFYLNGKELHRIAVNDPLSYSQVASRLVGDAAYEYFTRPSTDLKVGDNVLAAEVHQNNTGSSDIVFGLALDSVPITTELATPGKANSASRDLPAFPPVWINEIMPVNITSISDELGQKDPWVEIYNAGPGSVSLNGWHLTDTMLNLTKWAFPAGTTLTNGERLIVWLDAAGSGLHTNFRATAQTGTIALVFPFEGAPTVLDYINYSGVPNDRSVGRFPEGGGDVQLFFNATPGVANDNAAPALPLFINEWMASNQTIRDPSDSDFDDWFEIYNPNNVPVDLTGYTLTDNIADPRERYAIPAGFTIPAGGFLLVWADEESLTNRLQLHVPFKLAQGGENIGLYAPNGTLVDSITFGAQANNISQGRWPDGSASLRFFSGAAVTPGVSNVKANPNFRINGVTMDSASNLTISWAAEAGKTYLVQYKRDLSEATWSDLDDVTATSGVAQINDVVGADSQRFYRILEVTP